MTVQIVRLKEGVDVVTEIEFMKNNGHAEAELTFPMMFELRNTALVLQHWLPLAVMEGNSVMIPCDEILCVMEPNENFREYYIEMVGKVSSTLKTTREEDNMEALMEALEEMEHMEGTPIH